MKQLWFQWSQRIYERLDMSWHCMLTAQKASCILGCIQSSMASRIRKGTVPCYSALVRPVLQCCIHLWGPQYKEGHGPVGASPEEEHQHDFNDGAHFLWGKAENWDCSAWEREGLRVAWLGPSSTWRYWTIFGSLPTQTCDTICVFIVPVNFSRIDLLLEGDMWGFT